MFNYNNIINFKVKKGRQIFLYNFSGYKIKYFSLYNSILPFNDKKFKKRFKNYLSKSFNLPQFNYEREKKQILNLIFFNKKVINYLKYPEIFENTKRFKIWYFEQINKLKENIFIDFNGYEKLKEIFYYLKYFKKADFYYFTSDIKEKVLNLKIFNAKSVNLLDKVSLMDFVESSNKNKNRLKILIFEPFPYWINNIESYVNDNLINKYENSLERKLKKLDFDENLKMFAKKILTIYNSILNIIIENANFLKQNGFRLIVDESYTGFRTNPGLNIFSFDEIDLNNIYKSLFSKVRYDIINFGDNITGGLNFNILILNKEFKEKFLNKNLFEFTMPYYNPFKSKLFKYVFSNIVQSNIYEKFYNDLKIIKMKTNFYFIGPYIKISDTFNENVKLKLLNNCKVYTKYKYGILPLRIDYNSVRAIFSLYKHLKREKFLN